MPAPRVLVLGATGFAGKHFLDAASRAGLETVSAAREAGRADIVCDLLDPGSVAAALAESRPDAIVNLVGAASVGRSWEDPEGTLAVNAAGVATLLDAVTDEAPDAHVLCISSGEIYGAVDEARLPIAEDTPAKPLNPYAESKAAMEEICGEHTRDGMRIAVMRAFNHLGPGQSDSYAASSFARQIAEGEARGLDRVDLRTGDVTPERDFSDVRDVVRAYALVAERGRVGTYNVCSGRAIRIEALVEGLAAEARVEVGVAVDESRLRPAEVPRIFGSFERLREATGWEPEIALDRTLGDLLDWWRERVNQ